MDPYLKTVDILSSQLRKAMIDGVPLPPLIPLSKKKSSAKVATKIVPSCYIWVIMMEKNVWI